MRRHDPAVASGRSAMSGAAVTDPVVNRAMGEPSDWHVAKRLWAYMRPSTWEYSVAIGATLGNSVIWIVRPWLLHLIIDDVFGQGNRGLLVPVLVAIGAVGVVTAIDATVGHWFHERAAQGAMLRLRSDVLRHAQRMPLSDVRARRTGDIAAHLTSDATVIARVYTRTSSRWCSPKPSACPRIWRSCSPSTGASASSRSVRSRSMRCCYRRSFAARHGQPAGACRTPLGGCRPCSPRWSGARVTSKPQTAKPGQVSASPLRRMGCGERRSGCHYSKACDGCRMSCTGCIYIAIWAVLVWRRGGWGGAAGDARCGRPVHAPTRRARAQCSLGLPLACRSRQAPLVAYSRFSTPVPPPAPATIRNRAYWPAGRGSLRRCVVRLRRRRAGAARRELSAPTPGKPSRWLVRVVRARRRSPASCCGSTSRRVGRIRIDGTRHRRHRRFRGPCTARRGLPGSGAV